VNTITAPLKWPGGKRYLAKRIIELMPPHLHYVEPFFGGGAVLLTRDPDDERLWLAPHKGVSEVANDFNQRLWNFWKTLQNPVEFEAFRRIVEMIPFSKQEWKESHDITGAPYGSWLGIRAAVAFFVDCRQSRSGMMDGFTSITRKRTRRQMNGNVSEWLGSVDGLADVHARLRRVLIENMDAIKLIEREDTVGTFFYIDPPYVHSTRASRSLYDHEMTDLDHRRLLAVLRKLKGKAIMSGYDNPLYSNALHDWRRVDIEIANHLAGGAVKGRETEVLWLNY